MRKVVAIISIEWGYETHEIGLSARDWARVKAGEKLKVRGEGYDHEGDFFQDYWYFNEPTNGRLKVEYGEEGAVGFSGSLEECSVQEL